MSRATWISWGASVRGPAHALSGVPNQDAWAARHYRWGDIVAVADGIGSCADADRGAKAACRAVVEAARLRRRLGAAGWHDLTGLIVMLWQMLVAPKEPKECSATCLFVIRERGADTHLGLLGDGLIAACRADGGVDLLMADKRDGFANVTVGLGSDGRSDKWLTRAAPESEHDAFVLCTDGVAEDLVPDRIEAFARELYSHYCSFPDRRRRRDLRRWLGDWPVPGHADDKTIACLHRKRAARAE